MSSTFLAITTATVAQLGPTWESMLMVVGVMVPFFMSQWEEYHTHTLRTNLAVGPFSFGVTEAQLTLVACYAATGIWGPGIWHSYPLAFLADLGAPAPLAGALAWLAGQKGNALLLLGYFAVPCGVALSCPFNVLADARTKGKRLAALAQLAPLAAVVGLTLWAIDGEGAAFFGAHPRLVLVATALLFTDLTQRMIVASFCKMAFSLAHPGVLLLPVVAAAVRGSSAMLGDRWQALTVTRAYCGVVLVLYAHYVTNVIREICGHLGIECFRIKAKGVQAISR